MAVGDAPLDPAMESLVAAAGEAMTNAARWSGCATVSVYLEATPQGVDLFVRDRGIGFDPEAVNGDRRGIRDSIRGRLDRVGGRCEIISSKGHGTEVRLHLDPELRNPDDGYCGGHGSCASASGDRRRSPAVP